MSLVLYDLASRRKTEIVNAPQRNLMRARFSPDDHWISFQEITGPGHSRVTIIPFAAGTVPSPDNIIPLELHVAPGRLLFHPGENTGNIWMVEWKTR